MPTVSCLSNERIPLMAKKKKKESILGMIRKGKNYETAQAKRTKKHPVRKKAALVEERARIWREANTPVETEAERKKRLERERLAKSRAEENPRTRRARGDVGTALTGKEFESHK
jgi:hypothetical protein